MSLIQVLHSNNIVNPPGIQKFLTFKWNQTEKCPFVLLILKTTNSITPQVPTLQATCSPTSQFICTVCIASINGGLFVVFTASLLGRGKVFFYKWAMFTIEITSKESIQKANLNILHWQLFFNMLTSAT